MKLVCRWPFSEVEKETRAPRVPCSEDFTQKKPLKFFLKELSSIPDPAKLFPYGFPCDSECAHVIFVNIHHLHEAICKAKQKVDPRQEQISERLWLKSRTG